MNDRAILTSDRAGVRTLSLNRPDKLNAFTQAQTAALLAALRDARDDRAVHAIVLRGEGRGFCAGQDLEEFVELQHASPSFSIADHLRRGYNAIALTLRETEKPIVAALNGIAAGAGLSLALACDLRIAADDAQLTLGFSKIGLIPDGGGSFMLPLLAGFGRALELAWTSDRIDAADAHRLGLVNKVVPAATLAVEAQAYAERLAGLSPVAVALTKRAFNRAAMPAFAAWLDEEAELQEVAAHLPDLREGVRAFIEKRRPAFTRA
ncbi:MAG: enoyl-CoA hydratase/isomerase family protein [Candidatus Eremiobacteraeota bacterium]|nr:enoyl-CoA hydratase/isomerase family protein [Candidatus Eremiobacteraeota bacterium]